MLFLFFPIKMTEFFYYKNHDFSSSDRTVQLCFLPNHLYLFFAIFEYTQSRKGRGTIMNQCVNTISFLEIDEAPINSNFYLSPDDMSNFSGVFNVVHITFQPRTLGILLVVPVSGVIGLPINIAAADPDIKVSLRPTTLAA